MKIELHEITIRKQTEDYQGNNENGVVGAEKQGNSCFFCLEQSNNE